MAQPVLGFALFLAAFAFPAFAQDEGDDETQPVLDGKGLYAQRCASCHGETGDGRGPLTLALGQPARSFAEGGFAFGNTKEAMFRTVSTGVPGRSPMPGFRDVLSEEERWRVVEYVRAELMPQEKVAAPSETILHVPKDKPIVARGPLPSLAEGLPIRPRGLLVGLPEGLTFEYRIDDVRLLAVRQGEFADRPDWNGRGGDFLKPLGVPIYKCGGGDPPATFSAIEGEHAVPLTARLAETKAMSQTASLSYELIGPAGDAGRASEFLKAEALSVGAAFTRTISFFGKAAQVRLTLPASAHDAKCVAELPDGEAPQTWFVNECPGAGFECVRVRSTVPVSRDGASIVTTQPGPTSGNTTVPNVKVTTVMLPQWSPELLAQLSKEIDR